VTFQVGANASQSISVTMGDFEMKKTAVTYAIADVTNGSDKFTKSGHGFALGDAVKYDAASGTAVGGLTDGSTYYVTEISGNDFKVATSYQNALDGTAIALSGDGNDNQTLTKLSSYGGNIDSTTISVSSAANAATALAAIDTAISGVSEQRAVFGATINRLQYAVDNLSNVSLNTSASRSQVQDADYAKETSELARTQIIQQAATAMLSQANTLPQTVLQLLQQ
jgi:flagellin